ncbi:AP-4 complex subunit epsilon-like [Dendronephthya gigantea]|uniref:AP-4 complex subunit epsilon-like n=1 Tax=Dendronephthya gigantea TaxID=151771 RepID=UPI00106AF954|nr:AP-4 complex subunit epsilon-like [Dendronephthya gigantea]
MGEFSISLPEIGHHMGFGGYGQNSKGFQTLLHGIGGAKTKHEEDKIIRKELGTLKEYVGSSKLTSKQMRELLIRLIYCEMLGHDASFGYINAIKYSEQSALLDKKTGYLAASVFLNRNHSLVCLLINTIQKDLKGTNVVAKSTAFNVICTLVDAEKIPPLLPFIISSLKDKRVEIRKKAMVTLKHVYEISEDLVTDIDEKLRTAISDRDPIVVSAALQFFHPLVKKNPSKYRGYLKVFLQVLTQVINGKLSEYSFQGVQAPWIQIKLLKILALLGHQNKSCSESMSPSLLDMMRVLPTDCNIGCAVMFECIQTTTTIYPLKPLLDLAAKKTTLFLTSVSSNLKCIGITAMTALVEVNRSYAGDKKLQEVIIKCLDDDDRTIGKKILELLYKITNSENVCVICERLLDYIRSTTEQSIKNEVAKNLSQLANRYAPNITWYVDTINDTIQAAHCALPPVAMHNLLKVIAAGEIDDQRIIAARYLKLIEKTTLHDNLIQIACWVLGEYGNLLQNDCSLDVIFSQSVALLDRKFEDVTTFGWIMTCLGKLTLHMGEYSTEANGIMDRYRTGFPAELRQRCHEINILASDISLMKRVIPLASTEEEIKVCSSLSFLDNYVANALKAGARPYQQNMSNVEEISETKRELQELRFKPYEDPFIRQPSPDKVASKILSGTVESFVKPVEATTQKEGPSVKTTNESEAQPKAKTVWGPSGYTGNRIKKSFADPHKIVNSSSEDSSANDLPVESPAQQDEETVENVEETKVNQNSTPSNIIIDESPDSALFAGIKPKANTEDFNKEKTPANNEGTGLFTGLHCVGRSKASPEQLFENKKDSNEKNITSNYESSLLLDSSIEKDVMQESLQPVRVETVAITKQDEQSKTTSNSDEENVSQISKEESGNIIKSETDSYVKDDSELDANHGEIRGTDDCVEQKHSATSHNNVSQDDKNFKELCIDSNVRLVACAVHNQSELVMLMKLTNHNQSRVAIEELSLKVEPPSNLIADTSATEIAVDKLVFLETITKEVPMKYQYPSTRMTFKGTLRYSVSKNSKVLQFDNELAARHLLRPLTMSTEQFGEKWTSTSCGVRKHVTMTSRRSCENLADVVATYIHFKVIDIKGSEAILAGSVLANDACLLHLSVENSDVELWVKSSGKRLCEMVMKECLSACDELIQTNT